MCKPCVGAKLVLRFQALIAHAFLDRSIPILYHKSACTSGSICRKRISFISISGAIVNLYITIKQLNEWVKQFTLSVYASILLNSFLKVYFWFIPLIFILCIYTITTLNLVYVYKWVFSYTCVYYPVP